MTRFAVFLRAVNVGGHNRVPMPRLREIAGDLGYTDVATHVQSGNLVVNADTTKPADVEAAVRDGLRRELDVDVDVMVRSRKDLAAVIAANPFADIADDPQKLHVSFLAKQPAAAARKSCDLEEFLPERFEFGDRCLYLWYPEGQGRSKMAAAPWAKRLGVPGTARNWRTVTTMLDLLDTTA
jgi:uncharacterized protein (DUF1697 family)